MVMMENLSTVNVSNYELGHCPSDYPIFILLLISLTFMIFGNGLLLIVAVKLFQCSRMDIIILNQSIVDVFYCFLYPLVILDAKRSITDQRLFVAFKIAEDSLLTLSVLAVLFVNAHKYFYIKCPYSYLTRISTRTTFAIISFAWLFTPIGFALRNLNFVCRRNRACASSYFYCLASSGRGEISSIVFYISSASIILAFNIRLLALAMRFQNEISFRRTCSMVDGRKIFKCTQQTRRQRKLRIVVYPLMTSFLILITITPFWISMVFCQLRMWCLDVEHSLFYLMRMHSLFNPYCTLITHRKYRSKAKSILESILRPFRTGSNPPRTTKMSKPNMPLQYAKGQSSQSTHGSMRRESFIDRYSRNRYIDQI